MPKEAIDFLEEACNELKSDISKIRSQMEKEHQKLNLRVALLEREMRIGKWVAGGFGAGIGAVVAIVARECIPILVRHFVGGG